MKTFCTLSDYSYLPYGLTLYDSLINTTNGKFTLFYLCLDEKSYLKLKSLNDSNIIPIYLKDLIEKLEELKNYKIKEYKEFVWMLSSYFTNYVMEKYNPESITYIDADIYFYDNIQLFYDEIKNKSVGIIRHRHIKEDEESLDGKYNVGIVYFANDEIGKKCLHWWKDAVFYKKYPHLSTCYDQKYLEGFLMLYSRDNICVADETFAHGAPWHYRLFDWSSYINTNSIIWNGKTQKLLFNHFSRFKYNDDMYSYTNGQYADHTLNFEVFLIPEIKKIYDDYYVNILKTINKYGLTS